MADFEDVEKAKKGAAEAVSGPDAFGGNKEQQHGFVIDAATATPGLGQVSPNAGAVSQQSRVLDQLGKRAFGAGSPSLGARQAGAQASVYDQAANAAQAAASNGASQASGLANQVGVQGEAQRIGAGNAQTLGKEDAADTLRAQTMYGGLGGSMREQNAQLGQFNAAQKGEYASTRYDQQTGLARTLQQQQDASTSQAVSGGIQTALSVLSLLAVL